MKVSPASFKSKLGRNPKKASGFYGAAPTRFSSSSSEDGWSPKTSQASADVVPGTQGQEPHRLSSASKRRKKLYDPVASYLDDPGGDDDLPVSVAPEKDPARMRSSRGASKAVAPRPPRPPSTKKANKKFFLNRAKKSSLTAEKKLSPKGDALQWSGTHGAPSQAARKKKAEARTPLEDVTKK